MAFDELMGKLAELGQTGVAKAKELTDTGVAKAKEMAEIAKLKMDNAAEQEAIRKAYLEIGKLYYAERGMAPDAPYTALCDKITESKSKIDYNLERIADMNAASGGNVEEDPTFVDLDMTIEIVDEAGHEVPAEDEAPAEEAPVADEETAGADESASKEEDACDECDCCADAEEPDKQDDSSDNA